MMAAPTSPRSEGSVSHMAGKHVRLKGVLPKHTREACAQGMEQKASAKQKIVHQMLSRKAAIAMRTAEGMGSAVSQVATRHVFQGRSSVPSMVRTESAQRKGAPPTQHEGKMFMSV